MKTKLIVIIIAGAACNIATALGSTATEVLRVHNAYRIKHQVPSLHWDKRLARYAKRYAKRCQFKHSHGEYGENLAAGYPSVTAAIQTWYAENEKYSYKKPGFKSATGHFTQMIWKGTKKIGCALVTCDGKNATPGKYLVCEYSPVGNITNEGYFASNVLPPK